MKTPIWDKTEMGGTLGSYTDLNMDNKDIGHIHSIDVSFFFTLAELAGFPANNDYPFMHNAMYNIKKAYFEDYTQYYN